MGVFFHWFLFPFWSLGLSGLWLSKGSLTELGDGVLASGGAGCFLWSCVLDMVMRRGGLLGISWEILRACWWSAGVSLTWGSGYPGKYDPGKVGGGFCCSCGLEYDKEGVLLIVGWEGSERVS